jgi:putative transcriptional regulator
MINRPTDITLTEFLLQFDCATNVAADLVVLEGGPVQQERGFVLHSTDVQTTGSTPIGNDLLLTASREILDIIGAGDGPKQFMVVLGYAGWGEGQLEHELANNAWLTVPATNEILFDTPFDQRIDSAAKSLGIDFQLMSPHLGHA